MAKFDFNKPVASFSWYLQNGIADDKRGNRLHVGTGQKAMKALSATADQRTEV